MAGWNLIRTMANKPVQSVAAVPSVETTSEVAQAVETATPVEVVAAGVDTEVISVVIPKLPFSDVDFSLPERPIQTKDGKSKMLAHLNFKIGGLVSVQTGIWCREDVDKDTGDTLQTFSVGLPRGMNAVKDDPISAVVVNGWKQRTLDSFDTWYAKMEAGANKAKGSLNTAPRLVKRIAKSTASTIPA